MNENLAATTTDNGAALDKAVSKMIACEYRGETYHIPEDVMDDLELLEALEEDRYLFVVKRIVGAEGWTRFKNSVREESGRVPTAPLGEFLDVLGEAVNPSAAS